MRDSDIDSLSADGAQEPWPTDSAETLLREAASHAIQAWHRDLPENADNLHRAIGELDAALQASAPSPAAEGSGLRPGYCECGRRIGHP